MIPYITGPIIYTLNKRVDPDRGKILAVVTSCRTLGDSSNSTGFELTELARAYYVFTTNGFEVDIASPHGGNAPMVIDQKDMGVYDYAFLNDSSAQYKIAHTLPVDEIREDDYQAVYFVGGKGTLFDFPNNQKIESGYFSNLGVLTRNFEITNDTLLTGPLIYKKVKE